MIFLPWIVFFLGIAYMTWRALADKRHYLREQAQVREQNNPATTKTQTAQSTRDTTPRTA
jgi:hypothetical protein